MSFSKSCIDEFKKGAVIKRKRGTAWYHQEKLGELKGGEKLNESHQRHSCEKRGTLLPGEYNAEICSERGGDKWMVVPKANQRTYGLKQGDEEQIWGGFKKMGRREVGDDQRDEGKIMGGWEAVSRRGRWADLGDEEKIIGVW